MATELSKPLSREVKVAGVEKPVVVTIDSVGVTVRAKGKRLSILLTWDQVLQHGRLPDGAPAKASASLEGVKSWLNS